MGLPVPSPIQQGRPASGWTGTHGFRPHCPRTSAPVLLTPATRLWLIRGRLPGVWEVGMGSSTQKDANVGPVPSTQGPGPPGQEGQRPGPSDTCRRRKGLLPLRLVLSVSFLGYIHNRAAQSHAHSRTCASIPKSAGVIFRSGGHTVAQDTAARLLSPTPALEVNVETRPCRVLLGPPVALRLHGRSPSGLGPASSCFSDPVLSFSCVAATSSPSVKPVRSPVSLVWPPPGQDAGHLHQPSKPLRRGHPGVLCPDLATVTGFPSPRCFAHGVVGCRDTEPGFHLSVASVRVVSVA